MASWRDRAKVLRVGGKTKTAVGIAVAYVQDVLDLRTKTSKLAADRSRSLLSYSLLCIPALLQKEMQVLEKSGCDGWGIS